MSNHLGPVPHLHADRHGMVADQWQRVETGGYRLVTISDGALTGQDVLVQKRADGTATLFLLPTPEPLSKSFRLDGLGQQPLAKTFQELETATRAVQAQTAPAPAPPPAWTSAQKPTHIVPISRPDGQTTYLGLHHQPGPELRATRIGNPLQIADGSVMMRNGRTLPMTVGERARNQHYGVRTPADLPSLALGDNAQEERNRAVIHPDFRLTDEAGHPKDVRARRLEEKARRGGLVTSDLPAHYSSGTALMGIGPDGHVIHVATGQTAAMQQEMSAGHPYRKTSYAYLDHSHKPTGGYGPTGWPDRGPADDFLHHAIFNPAWVTIRRYADGKEVMYRHVYPRGVGKQSTIHHALPAGLTYMAERIHHPDDPQGSHWNLFNVIPNMPDRTQHRNQTSYEADAHSRAEDNRGIQAWRAGENPQDPHYQWKKGLTSVKYTYLNNTNPPAPAR